MDTNPVLKVDWDGLTINRSELKSTDELSKQLKKYIKEQIVHLIDTIYLNTWISHAREEWDADRFNQSAFKAVLVMSQFMHKNTNNELINKVIRHNFTRIFYDPKLHLPGLHQSICAFLQDEWSNDRTYTIYVEQIWIEELYNLLMKFNKQENKQESFQDICFLIYQSFKAHIQFINITNIVNTIKIQFEKKNVDSSTIQIVSEVVNILYSYLVEDLTTQYPDWDKIPAKEDILKKSAAENMPPDTIYSIVNYYQKIINFIIFHFYTKLDESLDNLQSIKWILQNVPLFNYTTIQTMMKHVGFPPDTIFHHKRLKDTLTMIKNLVKQSTMLRDTPIDLIDFVDSWWKITLEYSEYLTQPNLLRFILHVIQDGYVNVLRFINPQDIESKLNNAVQHIEIHRIGSQTHIFFRHIIIFLCAIRRVTADHLEGYQNNKLLEDIIKRDLWHNLYQPPKRAKYFEAPTETTVEKLSPQVYPNPAATNPQKQEEKNPTSEQGTIPQPPAQESQSKETNADPGADPGPDKTSAPPPTDNHSDETLPIPCMYKGHTIHHTQRFEIPRRNIIVDIATRGKSTSGPVDELAHFPYLKQSFIKHDNYSGFKQYAQHCYFQYMAKIEYAKNLQNKQLEKSLYNELVTAQQRLTKERGKKIVCLMAQSQENIQKMMTKVGDLDTAFSDYIVQLTAFKGDGDEPPPDVYSSNTGGNFVPTNQSPIREIIAREQNSNIFIAENLSILGIMCAETLLKKRWTIEDTDLNQLLTKVKEFLSNASHHTLIGSNFNDFDDTSFSEVKASASSRYVKIDESTQFYISTSVPQFSAIRGYMNPHVLERVSTDIKEIFKLNEYIHSINFNIRTKSPDGDVKTYYWQVYRLYNNSFSVYQIGYVADQTNIRGGILQDTAFDQISKIERNVSQWRSVMSHHTITNDKLYLTDENFMFSLQALGIQMYLDGTIDVKNTILQNGFLNKYGYAYNFNFWNLSASCFEYSLNAGSRDPKKYLMFYTLVHRTPEFADPKFKLYRNPRGNQRADELEALLKQSILNYQAILEQNTLLKQQVGHVREIRLEPVVNTYASRREKATNLQDYFIFGLKNKDGKNIFYRFVCHGDQNEINKLRKIQGKVYKTMIDTYFPTYLKRIPAKSTEKDGGLPMDFWDTVENELFNTGINTKDQILSIKKTYPGLAPFFFQKHGKSQELTEIYDEFLRFTTTQKETYTERDENDKYNRFIQERFDKLFRTARKYNTVVFEKRPENRQQRDAPGTGGGEAAQRGQPNRRGTWRNRDKSMDQVAPGYPQSALHFNPYYNEHTIQELQGEVDSLRRSLNQIALLRD